MDLNDILGEELTSRVSSSTDELIKQIVGKLTTVKLIVGDATQYVPKAEFNEKNDLVKALKAQVAKADDDIKAIKAEAETIPALKARITEIQAVSQQERAQFEANQIKAKKSTALQVALLDNIVTDPLSREILSKHFDLDKMEIGEDGKLKGFNTLLKPIKDNPAFKGMFGTVKMVGQEHQDGVPGDPSLGEYANKNPFAKTTLNITQQVQLLKTQPELAAKLKAAAGQ